MNGKPEHVSATCVVLRAINVKDHDCEVMVKLMKNKD